MSLEAFLQDSQNVSRKVWLSLPMDTRYHTPAADLYRPALECHVAHENNSRISAHQTMMNVGHNPKPFFSSYFSCSENQLMCTYVISISQCICSHPYTPPLDHYKCQCQLLSRVMCHNVINSLGFMSCVQSLSSDVPQIIEPLVL